MDKAFSFVFQICFNLGLFVDILTYMHTKSVGLIPFYSTSMNQTLNPSKLRKILDLLFINV